MYPIADYRSPFCISEACRKISHQQIASSTLSRNQRPMYLSDNDTSLLFCKQMDNDFNSIQYTTRCSDFILLYMAWCFNTLRFLCLKSRELLSITACELTNHSLYKKIWKFSKRAGSCNFQPQLHDVRLEM